MSHAEAGAELLLRLCRAADPQAEDPAQIGALETPEMRESFLELGSRLRVEGVALAALEAHPGLAGLSPAARGRALSPLPALRERAARQRAELHRVVALLRESGIESLTLKGPALREAVYRNPVERWCGDLDLMVRPEAYDAALERLQDAGYRMPYSPAVYAGYRQHFFHVYLRHPKGQVLELHWHLDRLPSAFRLDPQEFFARSRTVGPADVRVPGAEHLLVQCAHANLRNEFATLQYAVDVDRVVAGEPKLDWDAVAATAQRSGTASLVWLSLNVAAALFGTRVPDSALAALAPGRVARAHLTRLRQAWPWTETYTAQHASSGLLRLWVIDRPGDRARYLARQLVVDDLAWLWRWKEKPPGPDRPPSQLRRFAVRLRTLFDLFANEAAFCLRRLDPD